MQLVPCPFCGPRAETEFVYGRVAEGVAPAEMGEASAEMERIFIRTNPKGPQRELWQHVSGCRAWIVLTRNTQTHEITKSEPARKVAS